MPVENARRKVYIPNRIDDANSHGLVVVLFILIDNYGGIFSDH